jgi:zinc protease
MTMRTRILSTVVLMLALAAVSAAQAPAVSYKSLKYPPLNQIKAPEAVRFEMPNGMVVYLIEDHELPTITLHATVRAGSRWEPADKAGLAGITGTVMRTGGSTTRSGDQLDELLDRLGASVETGITEDSGGASASLLKEDLDTGLGIMADILQHPAFPEDKIELAKIAARDAIARRNDNPNGIVFREFNRVIFGKDSPYARSTEYATINAITRDDIVAFHKRFFEPENTIFGAEGDFNAAEMRAKIEKAFGGWARGGQPKPPVPEVDAAARNRAGIYSINKDDMEQSWVVMGMLGGRRDDPDYCALEVMNEVLGGGFSSRLFSNVRSAQGLAYAVFSNVSAGWDRPGTFVAGGSSKPETTLKIYQSMLLEVERMAQGGATADELARAKDGILKGMAFDNDSTAKILTRLMNYEYYGYLSDFLQRFRAGIEKVSQADVAEVARKYLKPAQFAVLVVGKEKGYEGPLSSLGKVAEIDISIPQPKQETLAAATPEAAAKGKALLLAAREAMGGDAVMKVKDYATSGDTVISMPQGDMSLKVESTVNLSGKVLNKMATPGGEMVIGFDGQTGWRSMGGQTMEMPASQSGEFTGALFRNSIALLQNFENPAYTVQALGPDDVDGKQVEVVAVSDPARAQQVRVYIDPATSLIVMKRFTASLMGPPAETDEVYSDYRDVAGVKMPFKTVTKQAGKTRADSTVGEAKVNPGLADSAYKKP